MYNKGSEWRKWDLHVHTPESIVHDYKKGEEEDIWEKFIKELESLPEDIKVLGINDYWFLDGYIKVKKFKDSGRLPNIELLLPVIELRLRDYVGNKQLNKINYHIVFSDKLNPLDIENEFIKKIEMNEFENRSLSKENLASFGKQVKKDTPFGKEPKGSNMLVGFSNFTISLSEINKLLAKKLFENKLLRIIGQTEWNDFRWEGSAADKKSLINNVDFIFSASPSIANALKSIKSLKEQEVNDKLLHCSDAHEFYEKEYTSKVLGHCFSWIKADPTFRGLQQVKQDFEERVFIGNRPPILDKVYSSKTKYIKSLKLSSINGYNGNKGTWFSDFGTLEFNKELIAIIGNKGNGKSAISDILGLLTNSSNQKHFSFLTKNKFLRNKIAENFEATLTFESINDNITKRLNETIDENSVERVRYIPQNYFEKLCNDLEGEGFEKSLQQVVFTHLSEKDKLGKNSFEELIKYKTNSIKHDIDILIPRLMEINNAIIELENKNNSNYKHLLHENFNIKWKEYIQHIKDKPKKIEKPNVEEGSEHKKNFKLLERLKKELQEKEVIKRSTSDKVSDNIMSDAELKILKSDFERLNKSIKLSLDVSANIIEKYDLDLDKIFTYKIDVNIIDSKINELDTNSSTLSKLLYDKDKNIGIGIDIQRLKEKITNIESELSSVQKEYQFYLTTIKEWKEKKYLLVGSELVPDSLKGYILECRYLKDSLFTDLESLREERFTIVNDIHNNKSEVIKIYKKLQTSIDLMMNEYAELLENYSISIKATFRLDNFEDVFFNFISQNKVGSFYGKDDGRHVLKEILDDKNLNKFEDLKEILENIITHLEKDHRRPECEKMIINEQVKDYKEFYKYLFSLDYLASNYELMLDGKTLDELSPGEKGALLLVFYLMLDKDDIPLIIDQPEDNLDNQSVVKIVVEFMKRAKKRRQIFMVTHNPNLAVVADAEQIIYVNIDKHDKNKFTFKSGSIENPEINNCLVDILEGTLPAFGKRKDKYLI